jgi:cytochrome b561
MRIALDSKKALAISLTALVLLFAIWLVSPFFRLDASDEANGKINSYRLALGLTVMILFVGKSLWDVLAPQGLAKKVSNAKAIALVGLTIVIMGFIVFTVARAAAYYLGSSIAVDAQQFLP